MPPDDPLLQIGAFARLTGVTPSMLRFYDDCGLVAPAQVDPASGYRSYSPGQADQVRLVRRLRELGLPLAQVVRVLDAPLTEAESVVRRRLEDLELELDAARVSAAAARRLLRERTGWASVAAGTFAAAVHRVAPAAAGCPEAPVLAGVLLEACAGELQLVATDRFRLAVQALPVEGPGEEGRTVLPVAELRALAGWAAPAGTLGLRFDGRGLTARRDDGTLREVPSLPGRYPDHRIVLAALDRPVTRVAAARGELLDALADAPVNRLTADPDGGLLIDTPAGPRPVPAAVHGASVAVAFQRTSLRPAVIASVGPDVVLEVTRPDAPVLVRSADDGTFSTLVMPTVDPGPTRRVA